MQIDLEPRDYRSEPVKGEPIFHENGVLKILAFIGVFAIIMVTGYYLAPVREWTRAHIFQPAVCSVLNC